MNLFQDWSYVCSAFCSSPDEGMAILGMIFNFLWPIMMFLVFFEYNSRVSLVHNRELNVCEVFWILLLMGPGFWYLWVPIILPSIAILLGMGYILAKLCEFLESKYWDFYFHHPSMRKYMPGVMLDKVYNFVLGCTDWIMILMSKCPFK
jgi:hypothetical protein